MKHHRIGYRLLLIALVVAGFTGSLQFIQKAHATGTLSIDPPQLIPSPAGTVVSVNVRVDNMDQFNSWHVEISTNTTALNGATMDYSNQSIFSPSSVVQQVSCINGKQVGGSSACTDPRMGIVEAQGFVLGNNLPPAPISGVIFTINYLAGQYNFTNLNFVVSGIYLAGNCQGSACDVTHDTVGSMYGTPPAPDFTLSLSTESISVVPGSSANATMMVASIHDFIGQINFTYTADFPGVLVAFAPNNVTLNNSTSTSRVSIKTSTSTQVQLYHLVIYGNSTGLSHSWLLDVNVGAPPDFKIGSSPGQIQLLEETSGSAIITVSTDTGFRGNVTLQIQTPLYNFFNRTIYQTANASLAQTSLVIGARGSNSTVLFISVPYSFYAFRYQINVTAMSVSFPSLTHMAQVIVVPPPFNILPTVNVNELNVTQGHSGYSTFSITSFNYFLGYIYPASTMSGGTARFNETARSLDVGRTVSFSVNVTIDPATPPGHYVVLLTATGLAPSGTAVARTIAENIIVQSNGHSNGHLVAQLPTKILGLSIPVYFGILGGFAAIFVLLAALLYRKNKSDEDVWE